ncbi:MAG: recombination mediator RecR [Spirochaetia bacterium]|nr:recombination mediator RecR [Spirochaetia bacterium]
MLFPALENVVRLFASLPGIGQRSALRIAFHLIRSETEKASDIADAITRLKVEVRFCSRCSSLADQDLCATCRDPRRDRTVLCVVEEPGDVFAIEKTGEFGGLYHVLMGSISPLDGIGPGDLRIKELLVRVQEEQEIKEILLATNPTLEGDATAEYIAGLLKDANLHITRISHGIPTGASIEYAEKTTLARSIKLRHDFKAQ